MYISQVIFETKRENEDVLKNLMEKKKASIVDIENLLSAECWWSEGVDILRFSLVTKWKHKDDFQQWLKQSHSGDKKASGKDNRCNITKTGYRFELVD